MSWRTDLFGNEMLTKEGLRSTAEALEGKQIIGVYFSAHWCPPCRNFTPLLSELYNQMVEEEKSIEIIFVSNDSDESSFNGYFSEMPWKAIPYVHSDVREVLNNHFNVRGIPTLILIDGVTGETVDPEGRISVLSAKGNTSSLWAKWTNKG